MNNNLVVIDEREVLGKPFRIYGDFENPLFLAKDVAEWIEYGISNVSKMVKSIDETEKIITRTNNTSATFLTEDGLYEVLMQSRKPIAKEFKKQVKVILKEIRKNGGYIAIKEDDTDEEIMAKALLVAQKTIERKNARIKELENKAEQDKPLVDFANQVSNISDLILVREFAKLLADENIKIGEKRLYQWFRENGYILKGKTEPTQKAIEQGLFKIIERVVKTPYGDKLTRTTKISGKGQIYFTEKLRKEIKEDK